jgi:hypothetical protein
MLLTKKMKAIAMSRLLEFGETSLVTLSTVFFGLFSHRREGNGSNSWMLAVLLFSFGSFCEIKEESELQVSDRRGFPMTYQRGQAFRRNSFIVGFRICCEDCVGFLRLASDE